MLIAQLHDLNEAVKWCNECRQHRDEHCDGCGQARLPGERFYHSQTFHYHPAAIGGEAGVRAVQKELCVECYRKDHALAYPDIPVPDLPDRGIDPRFHAGQRSAKIQEHFAELLTASTVRILTQEETEEIRRVSSVGLRFL